MRTGTITGILIVALVALSVGVAAAQYGQGGNGAQYGDANGDGVCDYNCGLGCDGSGMNFTDEDGDGVCDNIGTNGRDDDGDSIPNGQDDDYDRSKDGNGNGGKCNGCNR